MDFIRLPELQRPPPGAAYLAPLSEQTKLFQQYRPRIEGKEDGPVAAVAFCPSQADPSSEGFDETKRKQLFALAHGTRLTVHNVRSKQKLMSMNKFKDLATCLNYRSDGKLLVAGEAGGTLAVMETAGGSVLRRLKGHTGGVTAAMFSANRTEVLSASKDKCLKLFDITATSSASGGSGREGIGFVVCLRNFLRLWGGGDCDGGGSVLRSVWGGGDCDGGGSSVLDASRTTSMVRERSSYCQYAM